MRQFIKLLKPLWLKFLLSLILVFSSVYFLLRIPKLYASLINDGILKNNPNKIIELGLIMCVFIVLSFALNILIALLDNHLQSETRNIIQKILIKKIFNMGKQQSNRFGVSKLFNTTTQDVRRIQKLVTDVAVYLPFSIFFAIIAIFEGVSLAPELSWILIVLGIASGVVMPILITIGLPKFKIYHKLMDNLSELTRQNISGVKVIRAFNNETKELKKFTKNDHEIYKTSVFIDNVFSFHNPIYGLIFSIINLMCVYFGMQILKVDIEYLGIISAFSDYAIRVSTAFIDIATPISYFSRAKISIDRINEIISSRDPIVWKTETIGTPSAQNKIEFKNVNFVFPDAEENLLENISFTIDEGDTVAIVGSTGSGKTTLIELIMRTYDPTKGEILINGINLKDYSKSDLMNLIGYVPQKGVIFSGTISENISLGAKKPTVKNIKHSAKIACISDFIESLPDKYNTNIAQTGRNLSGGQKQRLAIARAIIKQPKILIFDDAFSALDLKTDQIIRTNLKKELKNSIKIIVAQRINTIKDSSKIIVLEKGKIVGIGSHQELLSKNKIYKEIAKSQLTKEDIAKDLKGVVNE